jgi:hypothetical protein
MAQIEGRGGSGSSGMTLFPEWLFAALVYGGIGLAVVSGVLLLVLLIRDIGGKSLW